MQCSWIGQVLVADLWHVWTRMCRCGQGQDSGTLPVHIFQCQVSIRSCLVHALYMCIQAVYVHMHGVQYMCDLCMYAYIHGVHMHTGACTSAMCMLSGCFWPVIRQIAHKKQQHLIPAMLQWTSMHKCVEAASKTGFLMQPSTIMSSYLTYVEHL